MLNTLFFDGDSVGEITLVDRPVADIINDIWRLEVNPSLLPKPKKVIYNNPATIILWTDGTKTISKCDKDDTFSKEAGFMTCMLKKIYGNHDFRKMMGEYVW